MAAVTAISEHSIMGHYGYGQADENDQIKNKIQQNVIYEINVLAKSHIGNMYEVWYMR